MHIKTNFMATNIIQKLGINKNIPSDCFCKQLTILIGRGRVINLYFGQTTSITTQRLYYMVVNDIDELRAPHAI